MTALHSCRDVFGRLVARTIAKQLQSRPRVPPTLSSVDGVRSTHCASDDNANLLSIDGFGAYDSISRRVEGWRTWRMEKIIPFVSSPSTSLEDEDVRSVRQGEGGEQVDPSVPFLFSLGQHRAVVVQAQLKGRAGRQLRVKTSISMLQPNEDRPKLWRGGAATRSNCWLRTVCPEFIAEFAAENFCESETFGGRGGGLHIIRRMPVGTRRNTCLSTPRGRHTQARGRYQR